MKTGMPLVGLATHTHKPSCCLNQELKSKKKKKKKLGILVENHLILLYGTVLKADERTACMLNTSEGKSTQTLIYNQVFDSPLMPFLLRHKCGGVFFFFFFAHSHPNSPHIQWKTQSSNEINIHCWRGVLYLQCDQLIKPGRGRGTTRLTSSGLDLDSPFFLSSPCSL